MTLAMSWEEWADHDGVALAGRVRNGDVTPAELAAQAAAAEQQVPGSTEGIRYQDGTGQWHDETAQGSDRPVARVVED